MPRFVLISCFLVSSTVFAQPMDQSPQVPLPPQLAAQGARSCVMKAGGWTIINCSNVAAASSAQLTAWTRYIIQCGDASYIAQGTAATGQDADANDGWLPADSWVELWTDGAHRYVSVLNKNFDSDCRIVECL